MRDETLLAITGFAGVAFVGVCSFFIFGNSSKRKDLEKELETTNRFMRESYLNKLEELKNDIAKNINVTVDNDIVKDAVDRAANKQYDITVRSACSGAVNAVRGDIYQQVKRAIDNEYDNIKEDVKKAIKQKIDHIDITEAKESVLEEAKELVRDKLEDALDETIDDFKDDLTDISKMYKKMSEVFIEKTTEKSVQPDKIIFLSK